jgi:hypothetical protein
LRREIEKSKRTAGIREISTGAAEVERGYLTMVEMPRFISKGG